MDSRRAGTEPVSLAISKQLRSLRRLVAMLGPRQPDGGDADRLRATYAELQEFASYVADRCKDASRRTSGDEPEVCRRTVRPVYRPIRVVGDLFIEARLISGTSDVREVLSSMVPGELYYVSEWNHFAICIGQCLFHANVGHIYQRFAKKAGRSAPEKPERIKECFRKGCPGTDICRYYHDPIRHPGSTDVRNYTTDAWTYVPSLGMASRGARRVGSLDYLEADVQTISVGEAGRFLDQTAHDLLCSLILWDRVISRAARPE